MRLHRWIATFLITGLFLVISIRTALSKPFWLDEGFEITATCARSYASLIIEGAYGQCSPSPLYYVIQKGVIQLHSKWNEFILVSYRAVSLLSSLAVLWLGLALFQELSWAALFFYLYLMLDQQVFLHFAVENRPYLLWLFCFVWQVAIAARILSKSPQRSSVGEKGMLAASSLALSLVTGPGFLQAGATLGILCLNEIRIRSQARWPSLKTLISSFPPFYIALGVICAALGYYYTRLSCGSNWDAGPYDLLKTKDGKLLRNVIGLFWPTGSLRQQLLNVPLMIGLIAPFLTPVARTLPTVALKKCQAITILILSQTLLGIGIGLLVAVRHYYFITRIFIFLVACRALLGAVGLYVLILFYQQKFGPRRWKGMVPVGASCLIAIALALSFRRTTNAIGPRPMPLLAASVSCSTISGGVKVRYSGPEHQQLNVAVLLSKALRSCGWTQSEQTHSVMVENSDLNQPLRFHFVPANEAINFEFVSHAGKEVRLSP